MPNIVDIEPVQEAIAKGQIELARNLLRILIEAHPDSAEVWYWAAQAAVNDAQRKAFLEKAVALDPLHHQAANELYSLQNPPQTIMPAQIRLSKSETSQTYAHFGRRALATLIDLFIVTIVATPLTAVLLAITIPNIMPTINTILADARVFTILLTLSSVIQALYFGYFLTREAGQTPGKKLLRVRVIKRDGTKITFWEAILRNVIGYQLSNILPGVGFLWMLSDKQSQTWHDMMSNTIVINVD